MDTLKTVKPYQDQQFQAVYVLSTYIFGFLSKHA